MRHDTLDYNYDQAEADAWARRLPPDHVKSMNSDYQRGSRDPADVDAHNEFIRRGYGGGRGRGRPRGAKNAPRHGEPPVPLHIVEWFPGPGNKLPLVNYLASILDIRVSDFIRRHGRPGSCGKPAHVENPGRCPECRSIREGWVNDLRALYIKSIDDEGEGSTGDSEALSDALTG